jgi:spermidine/putrescine transport system ATP-binding protein
MVTDVELRNVTKRYDHTTAVENLSLQVYKGEFFSLLGPSGCGKTTTLRLIAGFETPTRGEVFISNQIVNDRRPYERDVNTVFQNYALFPHLTVARNIAFGLERKKTSQPEITQRVSEALELVQLAGLENRYPKQLSGGQQQRVALARAIVLKPQVLLLDEPLGALDLKLRKEMQLELKNLQHQVGITFIYVTHDQEEALTMSDRIAVMHKGQLEQIGTPQEIYEQPETRFVADFIGISNFFQVKVVSKIPSGLEAEMEQGQVVRLSQNHNASISSEQSIEPGTKLQFSVRPERMRLVPEISSRNGENRLPGWIERKVYVGNATHFIVALSQAHKVIVLSRSEGGESKNGSWMVGDKVCVEWYPKDSVILRE